MSNEEHIEEMYYFAHLSGVFNEFSSKVTQERLGHPGINFIETVQKVFDDFVREGLIEEEFYLFI